MSDYVIVLVNGIGARPLTRGLVTELYGLLAENARSRFGWLNPGQAAELGITANTASEARVLASDVGEAIAGQPIDWAVVPAEGRRKKLLVADMESTVIDQECLDELAAIAGIGPQIAGITERSMRGELDFEAALRERVGLLKGLPEATLVALRERLTYIPGSATLVATMRKHGAHTALVSGGFTFFTGAVAQKLGFEVNFANTLNIAAGKMTGTVGEPILGRAAKAERLEELAHAQNLKLAETLAVGDGANDLAMVEKAGLGVGFRPKPLLAAKADANVRYADLTALLYFQGYRKDEFVG
jgi:phosphoserine phosphatase